MFANGIIPSAYREQGGQQDVFHATDPGVAHRYQGSWGANPGSVSMHVGECLLNAALDQASPQTCTLSTHRMFYVARCLFLTQPGTANDPPLPRASSCTGGTIKTGVAHCRQWEWPIACVRVPTTLPLGKVATTAAEFQGSKVDPEAIDCTDVQLWAKTIMLKGRPYQIAFDKHERGPPSRLGFDRPMKGRTDMVEAKLKKLPVLGRSLYA